MASDPVRVLLHVAALLDRIGTPYFLGGSLASSLLGEPRSTVDIDLAIALHSADVSALVATLGSEFYVEEGAAREAVARRSSFHAIHQPTVLKVDFFVLGDTPFDRAQLERRRLCRVRRAARARPRQTLPATDLRTDGTGGHGPYRS